MIISCSLLLEEKCRLMFLFNYVDDMIIVGIDKKALLNFNVYLGLCFKMKDLRISKYFRSLEVATSHQGILMSQLKYALNIIFETSILGAKPANFLMENNHQYAMVEGDHNLMMRNIID